MPTASPAPAVSSFPLWIEDHVRFADLDPLGHCNNAAISGFFESARVALFAEVGWGMGQPGASRTAGGSNDQGESDSGSESARHSSLVLPIVRQLIEFRHELTFGMQVRVGIRVGEIGRTSLKMLGGVFVDGRCMASNEAVGVCLDLATRRPSPITPTLRAALARYTGSPGADVPGQQAPEDA